MERNKKRAISIIMVIIVFLTMIGMFNALYVKRSGGRSAWEQVEKASKVRIGTVAELLVLMKEYARHEAELFEHIKTLSAEAGYVSAGNKILSLSQFNYYNCFQECFEQRISQLVGIKDKYPGLISNRTFLDMVNRLESQTEEIKEAHRKYEKAVVSYNSSIGRYPERIIAWMCGFKPMPLVHLEICDL